jgi:ribosomal protein S18 acetylase RimI-like enzyme
MSTTYGDDYHIRWMIRRDMYDVMAIEKELPKPLAEEEIIALLRERNIIGMVIDVNGEVVGYILYEMLPREIRICHLAVRVADRRLGFGTGLIGKLITKISKNRRDSIVAHIPEDGFELMAFFRSIGFTIIGKAGQTYEMSFSKGKRLRVDLTNRIRR